jgi:predicted dienelactone hydrolase
MNAWASRGFVVAAPDHAKNTDYDFDDSSANRAAIQFDRPLDITFVTDQLILLNADPESFLRGLIDPEAIGMSGASFGGHTTMTVAGATPNLDYLAEYCQTNLDNWDICPLQDEIQKLYPGQRVIDQSDPRMKAAMGLAPDGYGWFREAGMAKIKIPTMIMGGRKDTLCPLDTQQQPLYAGLGSTKYLLILNNADHFAYMNGCNWWSWDTLPICSDLHAAILPASLAFWMLHLKQDPVGADLLRLCVSHLPEVELLQSTAGNGMTN